uniref:Uncharacterized protein n=2 Tax=Gasterosteus aculeatus TaxID=69293 RepID=G3N8V7_GASAC
SCHVCSETFRDPVSLSCGHSFCSSCLQRFWEQAGNKNCPICKRKSSKDNIWVNFALKELADSFAERQKTGSTETEKGETKVEVVCCEHGEETKVFCEDEQKAVCPVCEFSLHQSHKVVPLEQAVRNLKDQLRSDLESLQDKRDKHQQVEKTYNEVIQLSKKQLVSTERKIRAEFNKLHQFLREEEESRLAALREEEEQKGKTISREMKMIEEQISSLSDSISAVEEDLQKDQVSFLSSYKATSDQSQKTKYGNRITTRGPRGDKELLNKCSDFSECTKTCVKETALSSSQERAFINGNIPDGLYRLQRLEVNLQFCPVILDPNTANYFLSLSDDLTSVRYGIIKQQLPDNPERFTKYADVLGSEGFSSGKHSWEVEVGDHPLWFVGLVKESVDRKGETGASTGDGFWCLALHNEIYTNGVGRPLRVKKSLQRIRVQLDYDRGDVSFYDPEDTTHIYTYRDTFTEKLFPYFNIGESGDAETADITICLPTGWR